MRQIVLIAHNLRSVHNIGSLMRTAEGLGIAKMYITGYSPYPLLPQDTRLPHISSKLSRQIAKTALGAEKTLTWEQNDDIFSVIASLKKQGYVVSALEQTPNSIDLPSYNPAEKMAIIVGREVEGIEPEVLAACDVCLEIPMFGQKESFNVSLAAAMALFHCRFT